MRNKIIICILVFVFSILCGCFNPTNEYVNERWGIVLPFKFSKDDIIKKSSYLGYVVIKVSEDDIKKFSSLEMEKFGYTRWCFSDLGININEIDTSKDLLCAVYKNPGEFQYKEICIDKGKNVIIFIDYQWAGY